MTKRDYATIADAIRATLRDVQRDEQPWVPYFTVIDCFAEILARDNPRFDSGAFRDACRRPALAPASCPACQNGTLQPPVLDNGLWICDRCSWTVDRKTS